LMEHGLTPSAISTRLVYMSAPENLQGAVAAGLLAVGSSFVGTMENCSGLLDRIAAAADPEALTIAQHYKSLKSPIPGFGHHLHKPVDPRACKLLELARAEPELAGKKKYAHSNNSQPPSMAAEFTMLYSPAPQPGSGFYRNNRERLTKLEKACGAHAQQLIEEIKALDHKIYEANAIEINRL